MKTINSLILLISSFWWIFVSSDNRLSVTVTEREQQQQMSVDKPDVMSEIPAVNSEQSVSVMIETGCSFALQLANDHRQYFSVS